MSAVGRLDPEFWPRAVVLFEELSAKGAAERARALAEVDPVLRLMVLRMLESDETEDTLLDEGLESLAEITLDGRPAAPEFEVGDRVGDFEVLGVIGRGGMGVVYEARDLRLGRIAALKFLPRGRGAPGGADVLFAEARAASALDHPNIATVYQVGESGGRAFIAMARHEGRTLRERLRESPLSRQEAIEIAIQVARALSTAHDAGIVHRDVKPGNIFLTDGGVVKLLDFGIATADDTADGVRGHGTIGYMSPEQARLEPPDGRSDVWSLGVVIHEMLRGEPVVDAPGRAQIGLGGDGGPLRIDPSGLPPHLRRVLDRSLSLDVTRRYRDGAALLEALETARRTELRGARLRRAAIPAAAAAMLAGVALRGLFAGASDPVSPKTFGDVQDGGAPETGVEPIHRGTMDSASPLANRLYEEGLRAFYEGDRPAARRFFSAAREEDPNFGMAAFFEWQSLWIDRVGRVGASDSALVAAYERSRALPERERLVIQAHYAWIKLDPAAPAIAESLATRHPEEPDGHLLLGSSEVALARPLRAIPPLRRVIEMDSLGLEGDTPLCRACDAFGVLADAYLQADSLAAAEGTLREWLAWRPESPEAWEKLASFFEAVGREEDARAARREEARFGPGRTMAALFPARHELRMGRWEEADRLLAERIRNGPPFVQGQARWLLAISLREQGRLADALETEHGRVSERIGIPVPPPEGGTFFEGQLLTELGEGDGAARIFRYLADLGRRSGRAPGWVAKETAWPLAHLATALASVGDTLSLKLVIDSLEAVGPRNLHVRDQRLHHYARGLLLSRRGDLRAAEQEFRRGLGDLVQRLNRVDFELARTLLALDRPVEAIPVLHRALGADLEGGNLYVSRTELHEAVGRAYEASGQPELAAPHYRWVAEAWKRADPVLQPRRDRILAALDTLAGRR